MEIIGVIAEYNPFHNGHVYQLNKIKELYPNSLIIVVINGYFTERGLVSLMTKEDKVKSCLQYGVDIVIELPFVFGTNSADIFASSSLELLNYLGINRLIFGSESNDINYLKNIVDYQYNDEFKKKLKKYLDEGLNYPTALNKANIYKVSDPNDLLGVSYIKAIKDNDYNIEVETIKRTNNFHDTKDNRDIISASNIREKLKNNVDISKYVPFNSLVNIDENVYFKLLKYKILTDDDLSKYLTVDEGIENLLKNKVKDAKTIDEFIKLIKTKRYTYNRLMRMFTHILIGLTKEDKNIITKNEYIHLLGFSNKGQSYINKIKKSISIPIITKIRTIDSKINIYEQKASYIYELITNKNVTLYEKSNKPIKEDK